jgi:integrase
MIERHLLPVLGDIPVAGIDRHRLRDLLVSLDATTPETAKQCRSYLNQVFSWCVEYDLVSGNPTPQSRILRNFHTRTVTPRKALDLRQLGAFLKAVNAETTDALTRAAMNLLILTWCRTSEIVGAAWSEFDLEAGVWRIPATRMKAKEAHTVYLSTQAVALLRNLQLLTPGTYLFPNRRRPDTHMSRTTLTNWRKRHGYASEMQIHGLRAVASTWANESGRYRKEVIEVALAHRETDLVRAAYNRATFTGELTTMWQDWADMCEQEERACA